jgi:hypothetical protein
LLGAVHLRMGALPHAIKLGGIQVCPSRAQICMSQSASVLRCHNRGRVYLPPGLRRKKAGYGVPSGT